MKTHNNTRTPLIRTAIIGVSGYANHHYRALVDLANTGAVRLVAATIINQAEESEKCQVLRAMGCELFCDYREMLEKCRDRLDLCIIPTGIHLHARMTIAALDAGFHVLVEKPAAGIVHEVDAMMAAEAKARRFVAVGYQHIYAPEIRSMKRALLEGVIGNVEAIKCRGLWPRSEWYYSRNSWAGRLKTRDAWILDAPFNNAFAHWLNLLCFLAGAEMKKSARPRAIEAELYRARPIESADTACLRIETEERIPLLLWVTHSCEKRHKDDSGPELEVRGSQGSLIWTPKAIIYRGKGGQAESWATCCDLEEIRAAMLNAVLRKASGEETFICGLEIARMQTLCANGAFESSDICNIDPAYLSECGEPMDKFVAIKEIEEIVDDAFQQEKLWSEMAVPWARAGRKILIDESCR